MRYFVVLLLAVGVISCDKTGVSELHQDIPHYWMADSLVQFNLQVPNQQQAYNLLFYVRNGVDFPHSNLYFKYWLKDSTGQVLENELVNLPLFHAKTGYPLGNGIGDLFEHQYELLTNYSFPHTGSYTLILQQYMRYDSLPEIYSVGYRLEQATPPHAN